MRLSDAIRLGSMMKPQGFGSRFSRDRPPNTACVLDAAGLALGLDLETFSLGNDPPYYQKIAALFPFIENVACPACGLRRARGTASVLWHLNDHHHWTREQIADWVETIEQQQEAQSQPVAEAVAVP